jgi:hypothetical protein
MAIALLKVVPVAGGAVVPPGGTAGTIGLLLALEGTDAQQQANARTRTRLSVWLGCDARLVVPLLESLLSFCTVIHASAWLQSACSLVSRHSLGSPTADRRFDTRT